MVKKLLTKKRTLAVTKKRRQVSNELDAPALGHAAMLNDPCGATLVPSVYPGDIGYTNRFVANSTIGISAGQTCWLLAIKAGNQATSFSGDSVPSNPATLAYATGNFPGSAFLAGQASKVRTVAACVTIRPNSAPNTATGTIHFGIVSCAALPNAGVLSYEQAVLLCTESVSASQALMAPLEVKWVPGSFDDRYNTQGAITDDDSDRNVLVVVGIGFPPATGVQLRTTGICEWSPRATVGIGYDATNVKESVCDKECVLRYLKKRKADWWWNLGTSAYKVMSSAVSGYYSGGVIGAMTNTGKMVGRMIR